MLNAYLYDTSQVHERLYHESREFQKHKDGALEDLDELMEERTGEDVIYCGSSKQKGSDVSGEAKKA
jgi:hypothetical protein